MTDTFRTPGNGYQGAFGGDAPKGQPHSDGEIDGADVGKALLVGLLGGLISAAGYMIYRRLPDEQKDRLNAHVRTLVQDRISELRQNFNI